MRMINKHYTMSSTNNKLLGMEAIFSSPGVAGCRAPPRHTLEKKLKYRRNENRTSVGTISSLQQHQNTTLYIFLRVRDLCVPSFFREKNIVNFFFSKYSESVWLRRAQASCRASVNSMCSLFSASFYLSCAFVLQRASDSIDLNTININIVNYLKKLILTNEELDV